MSHNSLFFILNRSEDTWRLQMDSNVTSNQWSFIHKEEEVYIIMPFSFLFSWELSNVSINKFPSLVDIHGFIYRQLILGRYNTGVIFHFLGFIHRPTSWILTADSWSLVLDFSFFYVIAPTSWKWFPRVARLLRKEEEKCRAVINTVVLEAPIFYMLAKNKEISSQQK